MGNRTRIHVSQSQWRLSGFLLLVSVVVLIAACGGAPQPPDLSAAAGPTPTATAEPTLAPTAIAAATASPALTAAPEPEAQAPQTEQPTATPTPQPTPAATPSPEADFGDAPDGTDAGYSGVMVRAQFPSLLASDGARVLEPGADTLGIAVDSETDARVVNQDAADDGVTSLIVNLDAAQVLANLSVMVRVAEGAPEGPRYLNALIDLDQDGAWGGSPAGNPSGW